jgi:hypothetical protein
MSNIEFNNFIGVFHNVIDQESCEKIIQHFQKVKQNQLTFTRQSLNTQISKIEKDTETYFLSNTSNFSNESIDSITSANDIWIFNEFKNILWQCYNLYSNQYGVLESLAKHSISGTVKIQRTLPGQGYHMWHCEHGNIRYGNRLALAILYLNDVIDGGETEFLYQGIRVKPAQGTLIICPSGFTHTHRGNPPLAGEKYIMNTWIEFIE